MALDLSKQVGPLPLGAWIVVVGGGLGIAWYTRRSSPDPVVVEDGSGTPGVGDGSVGGWVPTTPPADDDDDEEPPAPETNESWAVKAINWLIAQNYDAAVSDSAIRKYIQGNNPKPSVQEYSLQRIALVRFGSPPYPLPAGPSAPPIGGIPKPPVSVPGPVKPKPAPSKPRPAPAKPGRKFRYHIVKPGDNLSKIARKYRGTTWQELYNANRKGRRRADGKNGMISNPNLIFPGWRLLIP